MPAKITGYTVYLSHSLVPRPCPAFHRLQHRKAGRAWYLSWREHVIGKCFTTNGLHFANCSTDYMLNARCIRQSPSTSLIRVVSYLVRWLFLLFWAHAQLNHLFYPDITHVTRPSPAFPYWKRRKAGQGLGMRLPFPCTSMALLADNKVTHLELCSYVNARAYTDKINGQTECIELNQLLVNLGCKSLLLL